jgi:hypothetical protein
MRWRQLSGKVSCPLKLGGDKECLTVERASHMGTVTPKSEETLKISDHRRITLLDISSLPFNLDFLT